MQKYGSARRVLEERDLFNVHEREIVVAIYESGAQSQHISTVVKSRSTNVLNFFNGASTNSFLGNGVFILLVRD